MPVVPSHLQAPQPGTAAAPALPATPSVRAAAALPASAKDEVFAALRQLGELRDAGIVTPAEFEAKKAELLARL